MKKRGQLKIQEMAFVLLAVVFLFSLILLFFTAFQYRIWTNSARDTREARGITIVEVIASMPELRCSSSLSSISESVCIDTDKLDYFDKTPSIQNRYSVLWENSMLTGVEIQEIYPVRKTYTIYSKNYDGSVSTFSTYIALCSQENGFNLRCSIAKIKAKMIMPESK
jgi:hypothetical protein